MREENKCQMMSTEGRDAKRKRGDSSYTLDDAGQATMNSDLAFASVIKGALQLPDAVLARAFSFLSFKDRVTFAMSSPAWESDENQDWAKLIIGSTPVHAIDFGDCSARFAFNLVDTDLDCILTSICAVDNLKEFKLTNCYRIIGHGLDPLRGSTLLKKIDLSLVDRFDVVSKDEGGFISIEAVVPILLSILEAEQCSLKYVQFPAKWRDVSMRERLGEFIERYNDVPVQCNRCGAANREDRVNDYFDSLI